MKMQAKWSMVAVVMVCSLIGSGCSVLFVQGPPTHTSRSQNWDCTESNAAPVADTVAAGLFGIGAFTLAGQNSGYNSTTSQNDGGQAAGFSALIAVGLALSALHGYSATSKCRDSAGSD